MKKAISKLLKAQSYKGLRAWTSVWELKSNLRLQNPQLMDEIFIKSKICEWGNLAVAKIARFDFYKPNFPEIDNYTIIVAPFD